MRPTDRKLTPHITLPVVDAGADRDEIAVLLAREAGYLKTKSACRMLDVEARDLLVMRRRAIEEVFRRRDLPLPALVNSAPADGADQLQAPADTH